MKKNINVVLNVIELISLLFLILSLFLAFKVDVEGLSIFGLKNTNIIKNIILYSSLILEILVVSIELFLFLTYTLKFKFAYIAYMLIDIILAFSFNAKFPFFGITIILAFCIIKFALRIIFMDILYIPDEIFRYFDLYSIPVKSDKKSKSKKNIKKVVTNKTKVQNKKSATVTVSKKKKKVAAA